jgi:hypothetical protein
MNKKTLILIFFTISSVPSNAMKRVMSHLDSKSHISQKKIKTTYVTPSLPVIFKQEIFSWCSAYPTLKKAARIINTLAHVDTSWNVFINDDKRALQLIKRLSQQYHCSDIDVAKMLCTKAANERFALQRAFLVGWKWGLNKMRSDFNKLKNIGLDVDFSYKNDHPTVLIQTTFWQESGYDHVACWLIENGADINICTPEGRNAFMIALAKSRTKLIGQLLCHSALDVNHQDIKQDTPLHCCFYGFVQNTFFGRKINTSRCPEVYKIVKKLLEKGANPLAMNNDGKTPLMLAQECGYQPVIDLLENAAVAFKSGG